MSGKDVGGAPGRAQAARSGGVFLQAGEAALQRAHAVEVRFETRAVRRAELRLQGYDVAHHRVERAAAVAKARVHQAALAGGAEGLAEDALVEGEGIRHADGLGVGPGPREHPVAHHADLERAVDGVPADGVCHALIEGGAGHRPGGVVADQLLAGEERTGARPMRADVGDGHLEVGAHGELVPPRLQGGERGPRLPVRPGARGHPGARAVAVAPEEHPKALGEARGAGSAGPTAGEDLQGGQADADGPAGEQPAQDAATREAIEEQAHSRAPTRSKPGDAMRSRRRADHTLPPAEKPSASQSRSGASPAASTRPVAAS